MNTGTKGIAEEIREVYLDESQLDEIVREHVTAPTDDKDRRTKMMVLSLVSDLRNSRAENERITKERDELGEIVKAAVIPCHECMKNGCDCNVTYFSEFATGEMVAKQYNEIQQLREELEQVKKERDRWKQAENEWQKKASLRQL